jgi:hypothetical protein
VIFLAAAPAVGQVGLARHETRLVRQRLAPEIVSGDDVIALTWRQGSRLATATSVLGALATLGAGFNGRASSPTGTTSAP